jgi:hypothetical protein
MPMLDEWRAIKGRIEGFGATANLAMQAYGHHAQDNAGIGPHLKREANAINQRLEAFLNAHLHDLDHTCLTAIRTHLASVRPDFINNPNSGQFVVFAVAAPFLTLAAEVSELLSDTQRVIQRLSERGFAHLRRSIEANEAVRSQWQTAFQAGETACEKLGATHLLLHGIFAFKVNAAGARTDLVFAEPVNPSEVQATAEGLVLTEWKKVDDAIQVERISDQARKQADRYAGAALAGVELRSYRYIVLVSKHEIRAPEDVQVNGSTYRHISIPVEPATPSKVHVPTQHNR